MDRAGFHNQRRAKVRAAFCSTRPGAKWGDENSHGDSLWKSAMKLLTNNETANLIGLKPNTLEIWRWQGKGPTYRKVGRLVRYVESDVLAWLDAQARQSTSQYVPRSTAATQMPAL